MLNFYTVRMQNVYETFDDIEKNRSLIFDSMFQSDSRVRVLFDCLFWREMFVSAA